MSALGRRPPQLHGEARAPAVRAITPEPRRLLHVFPNFEVGGAQVRFVELVDGLGRGFEHTVVAINGNYEAAALLPADAPVRLRHAPLSSGGLIARLAAHRSHLASLRPDLLVTYNWGASEMALAAVVGRTPHLHMQDGFGPEEAARQLHRRVWLRRLALARAHVVVPSTTLEAIALRSWRLDPSRVHHIPNGVAPKLHAARALAEFGVAVPAGRPVVGWVGALRPEKNLRRLLRAFAPMRDRAVLLLVGGGPEHGAVIREVEALDLGASVRLLGARADARDILMQCHVAALSSDTEQMPLAVLEAMDAGLPVAACDVGDVRGMLAAENRPFVTALDEHALGEALATLLRDATLRRRIGDANRRRARTLFTRARMVEAHSALIRRLAAGRRAPSPPPFAQAPIRTDPRPQASPPGLAIFGLRSRVVSPGQGARG